jgi:hypothetical protein
MIPSIEILDLNIDDMTYPNRTYKITGSDTDSGSSRISGYIDELESIKQAISLILSIERYEHIIYSWDYGVELLDLYGKPMSYVMSELPRRIEEALTVDDRIETVTDFEFEQHGKRLHVKFNVITAIGNIESEVEVEV